MDLPISQKCLKLAPPHTAQVRLEVFVLCYGELAAKIVDRPDFTKMVVVTKVCGGLVGENAPEKRFLNLAWPMRRLLKRSQLVPDRPRDDLASNLA
jgi:hypothetical protein